MATMSEPDAGELEQLLGRCAAQDPTALEQLYQRVAGILLAVVMRILRQRDLAEDALQDVFVRIWLQARQYDQIRGRPLAWMISIARYRAIDLVRAQRRVVPLIEEDLPAQMILNEADTSESGESSRTQSALQDCLNILSAPQQQCLVLAYQEGLSHEAVASSLGQPLGTVKSWIRRGLQSLRKCLES
jgi:RNA polymerase sigma-70 factor (ECF subfamily)